MSAPDAPITAEAVWQWIRDGYTVDALVGRIRDRAARMVIQHEDVMARARAAHRGIVSHLESVNEPWTNLDYELLAEQRPDLLPALLALRDGDLARAHEFAWDAAHPGDGPC